MKRLLFAASYALSVAAVAALVTGATYGLFSATASSQGSTFSAGTVSLSSDATGSCNVTNMLPGAQATCTLKATYSGTVNAYMGLDVLIETQAGSGGTKLYNPTDSSNDLQVAISSTNPVVGTYTVPATPLGSCPAGAPAGSTCYELDDELVNTTPLTSANGAVVFTTSVSIPSLSTTGYQGGLAQIILTAHAVQSSNNTETGCSVGASCPTGLHWG